MGVNLYRISEVCLLTGVTRKTLFYYDRTGLLKPTERAGVQNHKLYDEKQLDRLKRIIHFQEAGLKVGEIRTLLDDTQCEPRKIYEQALKRLECQQEEKAREIRNLLKLLNDTD